MSNKIFVSYKYWDVSVYQDSTLSTIPNPGFPTIALLNKVTPRSYLNSLSDILKGYAIEKWENDDNDLSKFKDSTIESKLRDLIYDSSITIVLISPKMKKSNELDEAQWIPWEISYSLKEHTRGNRTSKTNALLAIVLPDENNSYNYCIELNSKCNVNTLKFKNEFCFKIIGGNFFNKKNHNVYVCNCCNQKHYIGDDSHYAAYARWDYFKANPTKYINIALENNANIEEYDVKKTIND